MTPLQVCGWSHDIGLYGPNIPTPRPQWLGQGTQVEPMDTKPGILLAFLERQAFWISDRLVVVRQVLLEAAMWEPGLWLRNLTVNYLSADEEAAARESRASSLQPGLLMTCLLSLCKPLLSWLSQKQSLGKDIFHFGSYAAVAVVIDSEENLCSCLWASNPKYLQRTPFRSFWHYNNPHKMFYISDFFFSLNRENCSLLKSVKCISS